MRFTEPEDSDFLQRIAISTHHLQTFKLFVDPLDPRTLQFILSTCQNITSLTLAGSIGGLRSRFYYDLPPVSSMKLQGLCARLGNLRSINMENVDCIRGDGRRFAQLTVSSVGPNLRECALPMVSGDQVRLPVDDAILIELARNCPNLRFLSARGKLVTNYGLEIIAKLCPRLTAVDLRNCSGITREGVMVLLRRCPLLTEIKIKGTPANDVAVQNLIARAALVRLVGRRRGCRIFAP